MHGNMNVKIYSEIVLGPNSAHVQTPLSNDTIDSVLQHGEVGPAKDLSAPPRNNTFKSSIHEITSVMQEMSMQIIAEVDSVIDVSKSCAQQI